MKMNQMNNPKYVSDMNMDKTQIAPGQETAPEPNSKAAMMKPAMKKPMKKKGITSITQLKDLAKAMKMKK